MDVQNLHFQCLVLSVIHGSSDLGGKKLGRTGYYMGVMILLPHPKNGVQTHIKL